MYATLRSCVAVVVVAAVTLCTVAGCSRESKLPAQSLPSRFADLFISPTPQKREDLSRSDISSRLVTGIVDSIRQKSPLGKIVKDLHDSAGIQYRIGISTPKSIDRGTFYPLIIYLHGGVGTTLNTKGERAYDMLSALDDSCELFLASPSANRSAPWWSPQGLSRILQTMRYMTLHYPIDPNRIILAGVSDGATGCYAAANTIGTLFAGFIAVSGYGGVLPAMGMELFTGNLMQRPIYNVHSGKDHLYPLRNVDEFLDYLESQGVAVTRKTYPDESHGFDYRARETGSLVALVRSWRRPEPYGFSWTFVPNYPNIPDNVAAWEFITENQNISSISGYFRSDTLVLQPRNLASVIIESGIPIAHVNTGHAATAKISLVKKDRALKFAGMLMTGYPSLPGKAYYRITF